MRLYGISLNIIVLFNCWRVSCLHAFVWHMAYFDCWQAANLHVLKGLGCVMHTKCITDSYQHLGSDEVPTDCWQVGCCMCLKELVCIL